MMLSLERILDQLAAHNTYLGVFALLLAGGLGVPIPEELPVLAAGVLSREGLVQWWLAVAGGRPRAVRAPGALGALTGARAPAQGRVLSPRGEDHRHCAACHWSPRGGLPHRRDRPRAVLEVPGHRRRRRSRGGAAVVRSRVLLHRPDRGDRHRCAPGGPGGTAGGAHAGNRGGSGDGAPVDAARRGGDPPGSPHGGASGALDTPRLAIAPRRGVQSLP